MPEFTIAGQRVALTRGSVAEALRGVTPEPIQKHAVDVEGRLYPVVQALEVASGVPRGDTRSATAQRTFMTLGMRLVQVAPGTTAAPSIADHTVMANAVPPPAATPSRGWDHMHAQPAHPVAGFDPSTVPPQPGVYAFYRSGEPVYVGRAIASGGLNRRLKTQHLKTGTDLSWSAFRRNVAEHLGIAPSTLTKQRPPQLTEEQVAPINNWVAGCELRWVACATDDEARQLEVDLKNERKPPLTKR